MSRLRNLVDMRWSDSGDYVVDTNDNDLKDTARENMQAALQHVQARMESTKGDWLYSPETGASLKRHAGRHNSEEVGLEMQNDILNELVRGGFLSPSEVQVQVFPMSETALAAILYIKPHGS